MRNVKLTLLKAKYQFLFMDIVVWIFTSDKWADLRKESGGYYRLLEAMYRVRMPKPPIPKYPKGGTHYDT